MQSFILTLFRYLSIFFVISSPCIAQSLTIEENESGFCDYDGVIRNNYAGAANNYHVNLSNDAGKGITWVIQSAQSGNYSIQFRYASSGTQTATQAALRVNGIVIAHSLPFPKTGAWTSWVNSSPFTVALTAGANTIRLETTVATEFANIDSITLHGNGLTGGLCYQAAGPKAAYNSYISDPQAPILAAIPSPSSSIDTVRVTPATFDVTSSGQANYKIPVITAPGSAGLVPDVSLNYSSGGGNGIMGLGWSLSAYGAISRCRQTEGTDGVAKPITWTNEDRFCLNGDRLLLASGSYGSPGSTYKTEVDSYTRITAVGGFTGHPDYFTVEYKDGIIETYGNTSDSYHSKNELSPGNSSTLLDWALSKRSDSAGNIIIYNYTKDTDGHRISNIEYAFGTTTSRGAYLQFNYENRNDPISGYVAGYAYRTGKRLSNIKSYNGSTEIRTYNLTYNQASAYTNNDKLSRINKIQECIGFTCSPATELEWELPDYHLAAATSTKNFPNGISAHTIGDFNGDGLQDIAWLDQAVGGSYQTAGMLLNRPLRYAYGKIDSEGKFIFENQTFANGSYTGPSLNSRTLRAMDLNNDGRMDLAFDIERREYGKVYGSASSLLSIPMPDGTWKLSTGPTGQKSSPPFGLPLANSDYSEVAADVNSDGIIDGIGWPIGELPWDGEMGGSYVAIVESSFDVTRRDLKHILGNPSVKDSVSYEFQPDADFRNNMDSAPINYLTQLSGDFNGDGVMDITSYSYAMFQGCHVQDEGYRFCSGNFMLSLSAMYTLHKAVDNSFELRFFPTSVASLWDDWDLFFDANNDGLSDILARDSNNGWNLRINNGKEFGPQSTVGISFNTLKIDANRGNHELVLVDINGDGYQDIVWQQPLNASLLIGSSTLKARYWDPSLNQFDPQEQTLGTLPYKIIANYNNPPIGTPRPDPRMINVLRFKTDRFSMSDVNGDGIPDLITTPNSQTNDSVVTVRLGLNTKRNANKVIAITNGLGEKRKISYERINETSHYSRLDGINANITQEQKCEDVIQTYADDTQYTEHMCWTETTGSVDSTEFYSAIHEPWNYLSQAEQSLKLSYPVLETFGPMSVVTDVEVSAPSGSKSSPNYIDTTTTAKLSYYYKHAKMQAGGRGFLGFRYFTVVNRETGLRTETEYRQDWPYTGVIRKQTTYTPGGHKLTEEENTWGLIECHDLLGNPVNHCITTMGNTVKNNGTGALGSIQPFLRKNLVRNYALKDNGVTQGILLSQAEITRQQDTKGNVLKETTHISAGTIMPVTKTSTSYSEYIYSGPSWSMQQGRLELLEVHSSGSDYPAPIIRASYFSYYFSGSEIGLLRTEVVEPHETDYSVTTTHTYTLGNRTQSSTTADGQTRVREVMYDARGRYIDSTYELFTNGTDPDTGIRRLTSQVVSRDRYGTPTETRRYVGISTYVTEKIATTLFGIPYFTTNSSGTYTHTNAGTGLDPHAVCPSDTKIWITIQQAGGTNSIQCSDLLGRIRRTGTIGFNGTTWNLVDTEYDKLGRAIRTSAPYNNMDGQRYWTTTHYDLLGRAIEIHQPYGSSTVLSSIEYDGYETKYTNPKGHTRTEATNALGQVSWIKDPIDGLTHFFYDARGNLREMRDPHGNSTFINYDVRDRKINMTDPNKGTWTYHYNRFNELICQYNSAGRSVVQRYDIRGRLFSREDRYASHCNSISANPTTQWVYDTTTNGLGQLARVYIGSSNTPEYEQRFSYDKLGRTTNTITSFYGLSNLLDSHHEKITYDQYGRVSQVFDAARATATFENNGVQYYYNNNGYLQSVKDAVVYGNQQKTYYTVTGMDARGNVTTATYGNGVTNVASYYGETGLAKHIKALSPTQAVELQHAYLTWDEVGNLTSRRETGGGTWIERYLRSRNIQESFTYDELNRLATWTTSGDFNAQEFVTYDEIGNIISKSNTGNYAYGNACPVNQNAGPQAVCRIDGITYSYDKTGSLTSDGSGRTIQYTTFDLPSQISKNGHTTRFSYGPNRERYKRTDQSSGATTTTLYLGTVEKIFHPDNTVEWKRTIAGVAIISQTFNSQGVEQTQKEHYLHKDHLGSTSLITDSNGLVAKDFYYDPWGATRTSNNDITQWVNELPFLKANKPIASRGYTGHEHMDEVGLIHMNGRIYDAKLARFVQADPIIQDPYRVQSLNRYSYVWNNPLNATDPSGFCKATVDMHTPNCPRNLKEKEKPKENAKTESSQDKKKDQSTRKTKELDQGGCYVNTCFSGTLPSGFVPHGSSKNSVNNGSGSNEGSRPKTQASEQKPATQQALDGAISEAAAETKRDEQNKTTINNEQKEKRAEILYQYKALEEKMVSFFEENPKGTYPLTLDDINTLQVGFYYHRIQAPGFSDLTVVQQYEIADTILRVSLGGGDSGLSGKLFSWQGKTYYGGEVNYLGVGTLAGYRYEIGYIPYANWAWNNIVQDGSLSHNQRQTIYGSQWAMQGALRYRAGLVKGI